MSDTTDSNNEKVYKLDENHTELVDQHSLEFDEYTQQPSLGIDEVPVPEASPEYLDHEEIASLSFGDNGEIPENASELNSETIALVEEQAGSIDDDIEDVMDTSDSELSNEQSPTLETKSDDLHDDKTVTDDLENENDQDQDIKEDQDLNSEQDHDIQDNFQPPQTMVQSNALGALGSSLGKVLTGSVAAVAAGFILAKQISTSYLPGGPSAEASLEANANFIFNPADKSATESFNQDKVKEFINTDLEVHLDALKSDMSSHLKSIDELSNTQWAVHGKSLLAVSSQEQEEEAVQLMKAEKESLEFKDKMRDLNFFADHIQRRTQDIGDKYPDDQDLQDRLDSFFKQWNEKTKEKTENIPDNEVKSDIVNKVGEVTDHVMKAISSLLSKQDSKNKVSMN